jgi:hypothetical protein
MQGSTYFDNQIVKVQNLEFQRDSTEKSIIDNFLTFTKDAGGVVTGLNLSSGIGTNLEISQGVAYDNDGERMELYSGVTITAPSGTNQIFATYAQTEFNPDPTAPPPYPSFPEYNHAQVNINPVNGSGVNVSKFNTLTISEISGANSIPLGVVTVSGGGFTDISEDEPYRQPLKLMGILNVEDSTIDGSIIALNSIDSDRFLDCLTTDIFLCSGVGIYPSVSGESFLGSPSFPYGTISTKNLNVTNISGLSPVNFKSDVEFETEKINISGGDLKLGKPYNESPTSTLHVNNISGYSKIPAGPGDLNLPPLGISSAFVTINGGGYQTSTGLNLIGGGGGISFAGLAATGIIGRDGADSLVDFFANGGVSSSPTFGSRLRLIAGTANLTGGAISLTTGAPSAGGTSSLTMSTTDVAITANGPSTSVSLAANGGLSNINITPGASPSARVNVNGTLNVTGGIDTPQGFDNLVPNSVFQNVSGTGNLDGFPSSPQIWNVAMNSASGSVVSSKTGTSDSSVYSEALADTYLETEVSGLSTASGTYFSVPLSEIQSGADYYLSYYYKASGINATADTSNLKMSAEMNTEADGTGLGITTTPYEHSFSDDNAWHKIHTRFTAQPDIFETPHLYLRLYSLIAPGDYSVKLTNVQVSRGKGGPEVKPNSTGSWSLYQSSNLAFGGGVGGPINVPGIDNLQVYSKGQFAIMSYSSQWNVWDNGSGSNPTGNVRINVDGLTVKSAGGQMWITGSPANNSGYNGILTVNYHVYLPAGLHTITPQVHATTAAAGGQTFSGGHLNVTLI